MESKIDKTKKIANTSILSSEIVDAYLEMVYGLLSLRSSQVQDFLIGKDASVGSSYQNENFCINATELITSIKKEGLLNVKSLQCSFKVVNRIFLIAMWDMLLNHEKYPEICNEPDIQFFRHVRNGCAHDNKFTFKTYYDKKTKEKIEEPRYKSEWRNKKITRDLEGKPVLGGLLKDGDPILLVYEVNNNYFTPIDLTQKLK